MSRITMRPSGVARSLALLVAGTVALLLIQACSSGKTQHRTLTERERDSTIGKSILPGAGVVSRSLEESNSA